MKANKQTKRIFQLYIGTDFSRQGKILFGRWLLAEQHQKEKSALVKQLWRKTRGEATLETKRDWNKLERKMEFIPSRYLFLRTWAKCAAVISLLLLSIGGTYWATQQSTPMRQTDMVEFFVPFGENQQITLPDGSDVWVKAGSLLVYPEDFKNTDTRTIYLTGEATFQVQKNKEQPFIVKTAYMDVQALGTTFTVESYPNASFTATTLEEGSVLVNLKQGDTKTVILKPSDQLRYSHESKEYTLRNVDLSYYQMARKGYLIFENATFNELISEIEKKYDVSVHYNTKEYAGTSYNVKFSPSESLKEVLDILHQLTGLEYTIKGNNVIIN